MVFKFLSSISHSHMCAFGYRSKWRSSPRCLENKI